MTCFYVKGVIYIIPFSMAILFATRCLYLRHQIAIFGLVVQVDEGRIAGNLHHAIRANWKSVLFVPNTGILNYFSSLCHVGFDHSRELLRRITHDFRPHDQKKRQNQYVPRVWRAPPASGILHCRGGLLEFGNARTLRGKTAPVVLSLILWLEESRDG